MTEITQRCLYPDRVRASYDARAKLVRVLTFADSVRNQYSGLGALATVDRRSLNEEHPSSVSIVRETYVTDAFARQDTTHVEGQFVYSAGEKSAKYVYDPRSGRHLYTNPDNPSQGLWDASTYDGAGNLTILHRMTYEKTYDPTLCGDVYRLEQASVHYYRADQRLAVTDKRTGADLRCLRPRHAGVLEESRYDALGRRILLRARRGNGLTQGIIERYVWDGAQLLYEMHYPGEDSVSVEILEADTLTIRYERGCEEMKNCGEHPDSVKYPYRYSKFYGRVAYTHGLGIDRPLALTRAGYGRDTIFFEPFTVMPHVNWQGTYDIGTFATGTTEYSQDGARVEIDWPAKHTSTYLSRYSPPDEPQGWFGSLIDQQRNPSGLLYRRNRYYEPEKGQFTQEDPIGLAGGLNLYGFANGDPVTYADPFGLSSCPNGQIKTSDGDCAPLLTGAPPLITPAGAYAGLVRAGEAIAGGARAFKLIRQAGTILRSPQMATLHAAAQAGKAAEVQIGGRTIIYEPGLSASGMTMFGENGFVLGRQAFSSSAELTKTVLHELHRLTTSTVAEGMSGAGVAAETGAAFNFAEQAYRVGRWIGMW